METLIYFFNDEPYLASCIAKYGAEISVIPCINGLQPSDVWSEASCYKDSPRIAKIGMEGCDYSSHSLV